ncbi:hypothetical protein [Microbacterium sp. HSID17254]|uniref:hypothetical protein n=1 Tax=Microbacterium sp. HSID17254 TaxID=2419509 RepID=UPI000F8915B5|nr:hypothetical protein [Microbacterium sp. HSID17254]
MRRRSAVPEVAALTRAAGDSRENPLLTPPEPSPVYDRKLQPLDGVRWPRPAPPESMPWEVPMFDVTDPGELQDW